jgi:hypothetical protein
MLSKKIVIGVDVGNLESGVVAIVDGQIHYVSTVSNKQVFEIIMGYIARYRRVISVIEDMKPFAGNLSQQAIDTCKFIGELTWRLSEIEAKYVMLNRSQIRKWVYDLLPTEILPMIIYRIEQRNAKNNDGKNRKPSFVYVNDGIVLKAMKILWKIETPKAGKGYIHGLRTHTWSALALASCFIHSTPAFSILFPQTSEPPTFFGQPVS